MAAFSKFSDLIREVKEQLNRNDDATVSKIPFWYKKAHDVLDRVLRHPAAEKSLFYTIAIGDKEIPIPTNLLELKLIRIVDTNKVIYWRTLETLNDVPLDDNYPTGFARLGNRYLLNTSAKKPIQIEYSYFVTPNVLVNGEDTNLYLIAAGDIIMALICSYGFAYLANNEEGAYWESQAMSMLATLNEQIEREKIAGSSLIFWGGIGDSEYSPYY